MNPVVERVADSRKLTSLVIVLVALIVLAIVAVVAVALFGVAESLFAQIGGFIATLGAAHQTAQAAADRSPNYPNPPAAPFVASGAPRGESGPVDGLRL